MHGGAMALQAVPADLLHVEDIFKIYREGDVETVALRGVSFVLQPGQFVAVLGRSGSGKSTLLNLLGGLDLPTAGRIWVQGQDITRLDERARAALRLGTVGYVYQEGNLLPYLTAQENVELAPRLAGVPNPGARATELLQLLGVDDRARHRPAQLSGGERQRVAVACALANWPALLLADEITGELDSAAAEGVLRVLARARAQSGTAVLAVTHNPAVAERADRVLRMTDGRLEREA